MPWSLERQSASCSRMSFVETVSRPSYTHSAPVASILRPLCLSGSMVHLPRRRAAFRYWLRQRLPLSDYAAACCAPFEQTK